MIPRWAQDEEDDGGERNPYRWYEWKETTMGDMTDMINQGGEEEMDEHDDSYSPPLKTCRYCRASNLTWGNLGDTEDKWRLVDSITGKLHVCPVNPLKEESKPSADPVSRDPIERAFRAGFDAGYLHCSDQAWPEVGPGSGAPDAKTAYRTYLNRTPRQ